jgi:DNA-binding CsgD family transcriptional regulator
MNKTRVNIAVLEPSDIVYQGLSTIIMKAGNDYYLYRVNGFEEILNMYPRLAFSVVIMNPDVVQYRLNDFARLKKELPGVCWLGLIYSFFGNKVLKNFDKTFSITDNAETILTLVKNAFSQNKEGNEGNQELSDREIDVLKMLTRGLSNKEIADQLHISIHTVISHRKNLVEKTGIKSLPGLTIYAISQNIISIDQSRF